MSFHIDLLPFRPLPNSPELDPTSPQYCEWWATGELMSVDENGRFYDVMEIDYSLNECVQKGWYDPGCFLSCFDLEIASVTYHANWYDEED